MTNREIASVFSRMADLMELHDENEFKVRTYRNAYVAIRRFPEPIEEMEPEAIMGQRGIGKTVVAKIEELLDYDRIDELSHLEERTPQGILEMLAVKGLGPKKIKTIWKEMGIEDVTSLIYACHENRLIEAKGFGVKTQNDLIKKLDFYMSSRDKHLYPQALELAQDVIAALNEQEVEAMVCGELIRGCEIIEDIEVMCDLEPGSSIEVRDHAVTMTANDRLELLSEEGAKIVLWLVGQEDPASAMLRLSRPKLAEGVTINILKTDWELGVSYDPASEYWDNQAILDQPELQNEIICQNDVRGVIHNHSTYSDGSHSIEQMAMASRSKGYEYLVMSDHSRSAFYANGLDEDRVLRQWEEIDRLNEQFEDFKIFKSIESDILYDGSLDYSDQFLEGFDLVIASIHSQLRMEKSKAMERLINAISHPATRILGHPTGRLLLGREGYPIDHKAIIDACKAHSVVIELNANPLRLDVDWRYIGYAQEQGVMVSINPDAHHIDGIDDIKYGVLAARKGGLKKSNCLCAKSREEFENWLG